MRVSTVYNLLEFLKKEHPEYEEKAIRLLKFLYNDVCQSLESNIVEFDEKDAEMCSICSDFLSDIVEFIDDDDSSILNYFDEMMRDGNVEFIELFFNKLETYFKIIDNSLYRSDDFSPFTFVFNIYIMLKGYHIYKEDVDRFSKILNDYSGLVKPGGIVGNYVVTSTDFLLSQKKEIIDRIFEIDCFENVPILKEKFNNYFVNICSLSDNSEELDDEIECLKLIKIVIDDMEKLRIKDPSFDMSVGIGVIEGLSSDYHEDYSFFYAPILLHRGDRYEYINECYDLYLSDNPNYMFEIMEMLLELNNDLFVYLDSVRNDGSDSFISCMDIVFDSDSLQEVKNKLEILIEASNFFAFSPVSYVNVRERINQLSSDTNKKVVNGRKIMLDIATVNQVDRPDDILERMVECYSSLFNVSKDELFSKISDDFEVAESIVEFEEFVDESIESLLEEQKQQEELRTLENNNSELVAATGNNRDVPKTFKKLFGRK